MEMSVERPAPPKPLFGQHWPSPRAQRAWEDAVAELTPSRESSVVDNEHAWDEPASIRDRAAPVSEVDQSWSAPVPVALAEDDLQITHRRSTQEIGLDDLEPESAIPPRAVRPRKSTLVVAPLPTQLTRPFSQRFAQKPPRRRWLAICVVGGLAAVIAIVAPRSPASPSSLIQRPAGLGDAPMAPAAAAPAAAAPAPPAQGMPEAAAATPTPGAPDASDPVAGSPASRAADPKLARLAHKAPGAKAANKAATPTKSSASRTTTKPGKSKNRGVPTHDTSHEPGHEPGHD
jgi:hypothetical protein